MNSNEALTLEKSKRWRMFDITWALGCFGTAIGAGVLFFPIKAGAGGLIPFIIMLIISFPIAYFSHRGLARFVLSGTKDGDITSVVEEHFGKKGGTLLTFLYFIAIWPLLWLYGVAVTNTIISFSENQLKLGSPNRAIVALVCILILAFIIKFGRDIVVKAMGVLVYPFIIALVVISICLIPYWSTDFLTTSASNTIEWFGQHGILLTIAGGVSIAVFSFNHSPIISSFAVATREEYGKFGQEVVERKASRNERLASILMCSVVLFFSISCVLTLTHHDILEAKSQNIPILSYLANYFTSGKSISIGGIHYLAVFLQWIAPIIAIVAIFKSFFGHYLGTFEGLNGLVLRIRNKKEEEVNIKYLHGFSMFFILATTWLVTWLNPSVLDLIDALGAPLIALLLCILPMASFQFVPKLRKYKTSADWWVWLVGIITILVSINVIIEKIIS